MKLFTDSDETRALSKPYNSKVVCAHVLLPEAMLRLVQQDKGLNRKDAEVVLRESTPYGKVFHKKDDGANDSDIAEEICLDYAKQFNIARQN